MTTRTIQPVINILNEIVRSGQVDIDKLDEALDYLEGLKANVDEDDDAAVDMVDEVQDYIQYLMTLDETEATDEIKEEITEVIEDLRQWSR